MKKKFLTIIVILIVFVPMLAPTYILTAEAASKPQKVIITSVRLLNNASLIEWKKVKGNGYQIYRSVDGGKYIKLSTLKKSSKTSYTDKKLEDGKNSYKIRAFKKLKKKTIYGKWSKVKSITYSKSGDEGVPSAPTGITKVTCGAHSITFKWDEVAGAESYNVYMVNSKKTTTVKPGNLIGNTTKTQFTATQNLVKVELQPEVGYYFGLTALNSKGESKLSSIRYYKTAKDYEAEKKAAEEEAKDTALVKEYSQKFADKLYGIAKENAREILNNYNSYGGYSGNEVNTDPARKKFDDEASKAYYRNCRTLVNSNSFDELSGAMKVWTVDMTSYFQCRGVNDYLQEVERNGSCYGMVYWDGYPQNCKLKDRKFSGFDYDVNGNKLTEDEKYLSDGQKMKYVYEGVFAGVCKDYAHVETVFFKAVGLDAYYESYRKWSHAWSVVRTTNSNGERLYLPFNYRLVLTESDNYLSDDTFLTYVCGDDAKDSSLLKYKPTPDKIN